jgi:hypothetical protein
MAHMVRIRLKDQLEHHPAVDLEVTVPLTNPPLLVVYLAALVIAITHIAFKFS